MTALRRDATPVALALLLLSACGPAAEEVPVDATGGPITPTTPVTATTETWTWVPITGAACGNGSATGIGVNLTSASTDVFVYLQGGGACWDALTCFTLGTAANLNGFGQTQFDQFVAGLSAEILDRGSATNPFKDASWVFVPYCTGDLHSGAEVHTYGTSGTVSHVGALNLEAILPRLAATFPGTRRIFVTGSSAGGYGVQLRFHRFVAAFPAAAVHGLADGAQPVDPNPAAFGAISLPAVISAWNAQFPPGCSGCTTSFSALADHLAATWSAKRIGLTASTDDSVLSAFFGYSTANYAIATRALLASPAYQSSAAQRYFARKTTSHTMLGNIGVTEDGGTLTLRDWLVRWRDGDPAWDNVDPAP